MEQLQNASGICYNWFKTCDENNLILSFKGDFNQDLINAILFLTEERPQLQEKQGNIRQRIFGIMVESMQNICKHGVKSEVSEEMKPGIVLIGRKDTGFRVATGNLLLNEEIDHLKEKIDHVISLSKEELKALHREVLLTTKLSEKSGAGLGMISIARKSNGIEYNFQKLNDRLSFFGFEVTILPAVN